MPVKQTVAANVAVKHAQSFISRYGQSSQGWGRGVARGRRGIGGGGEFELIAHVPMTTT